MKSREFNYLNYTLTLIFYLLGNSHSIAIKLRASKSAVNLIKKKNQKYPSINFHFSPAANAHTSIF